MARNFLEEINIVKSRTAYSSRIDYLDNIRGIQSVVDSIESSKSNDQNEMLKYIPIAIVACLQGYFRAVIKDLIDSGDPFRKNASNFNKNKQIRFDFEIVNAIHSENLTMGDFISHILPFSSLSDIDSNLSTIIDGNFLKQIKDFDGSNRDFSGLTSITYKNNVDQIIPDINKIFELRNIFCHEFSSKIKVDKIGVLQCFSNFKIFIKQIDLYIGNLLYHDIPINQNELTEYALQEYEKANEKLKNLINEILVLDKEKNNNQLDEKLFQEAMMAWSDYREAMTISDASVFKGGSSYNFVYNTSNRHITQEKIESLTKEYQFLYDPHYDGNLEY